VGLFELLANHLKSELFWEKNSPLFYEEIFKN